MNARSLNLLPLAVLALSLAAPAEAAPSYTKSDTYRNPAIKAGGGLELTNLLGQVNVVPAADGVLAVDSRIVAAADSDAEAQALAGKIRIETQVNGNTVTMLVHYPLDEYDRYFYRRGEGFNLGFDNTSTSYEGERVRISSGTFGEGVNLHVDLTVHLPQGVALKVDNKVGQIDADDLAKSSLEFESGSGDIKGSKLSGGLKAHTGSGDITLDGEDGAVELATGSGDVSVGQQKGGDVTVKTGSGGVKLDTVAGKLDTRTGSGDVKLVHYSGPGAELETGSGDITINGADGSLRLRTGSGHIAANDYKAGEAVEAHAGSGDIDLDGDFSGVLRLSAESGSGDIVIHTSSVPSLHIEATSDSGDVNVDLPGMQNVSLRHHSFRADVNGAKGSAELESGSGDVTFTKH